MLRVLENLIRLSVVVAPILGVARLATRRSRQLSRIRTYLQLATDLEPHDLPSAARVRELAKEAVRHFSEAESASLARRLDPSAVAAWLFLLFPCLIGVAWGFTADGWWRWPVIVVSTILAILIGVSGWTVLWKEREADKLDAAAR